MPTQIGENLARNRDCGGAGVMVPQFQNAAEARAIVEACLYAPRGHRSAFGSGLEA